MLFLVLCLAVGNGAHLVTTNYIDSQGQACGSGAPKKVSVVMDGCSNPGTHTCVPAPPYDSGVPAFYQSPYSTSTRCVAQLADIPYPFVLFTFYGPRDNTCEGQPVTYEVYPIDQCTASYKVVCTEVDVESSAYASGSCGGAPLNVLRYPRDICIVTNSTLPQQYSCHF